MSKFTQKQAQISFCSKVKEQNGQIGKKAIRSTEICKKTSPKNKQILIKTSPKASNPQVFKKTSPNSRKNRKVGNTERQVAKLASGLLYS